MRSTCQKGCPGARPAQSTQVFKCASDGLPVACDALAFDTVGPVVILPAWSSRVPEAFHTGITHGRRCATPVLVFT